MITHPASCLDQARDKSEKKFAELCLAKNLQVVHATKNQDMYEHWDWKVTNPNTKKVSLIDVKGARKKSRSDTKIDYDITWLEFKNVRGNSGSLWGKADYIAFEQKEYFLICKRTDLINWLKGKIINKTFVNYSKDAMYRYYQRIGRQDVITMVRIKDIEQDLNCGKLLK